MFVVQATCHGLTRRLTFDTQTSFPYYTDIQKKVSLPLVSMSQMPMSGYNSFSSHIHALPFILSEYLIRS